MDLIDALLDLCKTTPRPIIAIDGPAGAGKTTLASNLHLALYPDFTSTIIHMDDLYNGWEKALTPELSKTLTSIASTHQAGQKISISKYDWVHSTFLQAESIPPAQLLILEGVGSGQRAIREYLSALIWIEIERTSGLSRVLERDGDGFRDPMQKWLATQEQHFTIEKTDNAADFVLTT
jgi:uridine kinase